MSRAPSRVLMLSLATIGWVLPGLAAADSVRQAVVGGMSFEDRVACHTAIERIYWRHRAWPAENPGAKPAFESVIAASDLVAKAEDSLRKSRALEEYWGRSIEPAALQAELDRMVAGTKRPEILREIFVALGDDPVLADRLLRDWYASDERLHARSRADALRDLERFGEADLLRLVSGRYREIEVAPSDEEGFGNLVGRSARMRSLFALLNRIAPTTQPKKSTRFISPVG